MRAAMSEGLKVTMTLYYLSINREPVTDLFLTGEEAVASISKNNTFALNNGFVRPINFVVPSSLAKKWFEVEE